MDAVLRRQLHQDFQIRRIAAVDALSYAANDVLYLHDLKARLDELLVREDRMAYAQACFDFLPYAGMLDVAGFNCETLFTH